MGQIQYYPINRIQANLNTTGNLFLLNGVPYKGAYYLTYDGKAFTGINPLAGGNELLTPIEEAGEVRSRISRRLSRTRSVQTSQNIQTDYQPTKVQPRETLQQYTPYFPVATEYDYQKGYFTRYFAKKINMNSYIIEISYEDYATAINDLKKNLEDYEVMEMMWQLKGPRHDKRVSQYQIIGGVYDTNKRVTENKAKSFNGIVQYIDGNYTKFARLDPE